MERRQIEYAVGVADHGGFVRAARALHVAQPSLSQGVARLEAELGALLFHRLGRSVTPTDAGLAFLGPARQVLADLQVLETSVAATSGLERGMLAICALPTLAVDPLAELVGSYRLAHPGITVRLEHPESVDTLAQRIRNGGAEIGLTELPVPGHPDDAAGLVAWEVLRQDFLVVLPPGSPLAGRARLRVDDLVGIPLVTTPVGTSIRRILDAAFTRVGAGPSIAVETDQREAIGALVQAGAGAALLPRPLALDAARRGAVTVALAPKLQRTLGVIHRAAPLSPAARAFLGLLPPAPRLRPAPGRGRAAGT
jgi:LysR family carnitine catabolism transcriptional activator